VHRVIGSAHNNNATR